MTQHGDRPSAVRKLTCGLARGDDASWAQFHQEFGPTIFRQLVARTRGDHDLASEALQQTYLRVARYVRPCDHEAMFWGWLRTVAATALSDCRRRRQSFWSLLRRQPPTTESDPRFEGEQRALDALDEAMASLAPAERQLLTDKYLRAQDVRTLAESMGLTVKAVESRLSRARANVRERMQAILSAHEPQR